MTNTQTLHPGTITPKKNVPEHIQKPPYATTGKPNKPSKQLIANKQTIQKMRSTCKLAAKILQLTCQQAKQGVTTDQLDTIAHNATIEHNAYPSPLNYHNFPKSICTSVNQVICHGIPDSRPLQNGDILNIDITIYKDGVHGDCSKMVLIGDVTPQDKLLVDTTYTALMNAIKTAKPGAKLRDLAKAIEKITKPQKFSIVQAYCGHGIGVQFHNGLMIFHHYDPSQKLKLKPGMIFTIEPMINIGTHKHKIWPDNWTAVTADNQKSAQFEHTILITQNGAEILTLPEGEKQPFI